MLKQRWTLLGHALLISLFIGCAQLTAADIPFVKGFNLTEDGEQLMEIGKPGHLSRAQLAVLEAKRLGANHIIINPRAAMLGPFTNIIVPIYPQNQTAEELAEKMVPFLRWIRSQQMTVQIRPILFVVKELRTLTPYITNENGVKKTWWHGNIRPSKPKVWFHSLREYHDLYLSIARLAEIEFYTIGAELYSMTVGMENDEPDYRLGFAKEWNEFLKYVRHKLGHNVTIMYDLTFTDDTVNNGGSMATRGGELQRWRYRLVDAPHDDAWYELKKFWLGLDAIGVDIYRSLADAGQKLPTQYPELVATLQTRTDRYANEMSSAVIEIEMTVEERKPFMFKEVGFRSSDKGLVDPFIYDNPSEKVNLLNQAAAYQAFINSFFKNQREWLNGVSFWDISIEGRRRGEHDAGFTPLGKKQTEHIIMDFFEAKP